MPASVVAHKLSENRQQESLMGGPNLGHEPISKNGAQFNTDI